MELNLNQPVWVGFDLGDAEGDQTAITYCIPPGAEDSFRAFFGGALPEWVRVIPVLSASIPTELPPPQVPKLLPAAANRRIAQWKREGGAGWRRRTR